MPRSDVRGSPLYISVSCLMGCRTNISVLRREDLLLYSGGMPRASFSDRHTITAQQADKHVVFDFTSRVIDFFTIDATDDQKGTSCVLFPNSFHIQESVIGVLLWCG